MFTGREALFSVEQAISRVRADERPPRRGAPLGHGRSRTAAAGRGRRFSRARARAPRRDDARAGDRDARRRRAAALAMIENHRKELDALARRRAEQPKPRSTRRRRLSTIAIRTLPTRWRRSTSSGSGPRNAFNPTPPGARRSRPSRRPKRSRRTPMRKRRRPKPTSPPRASPTKTIRCSFICGARSTGRRRTGAASSCASSTARSPGSWAIGTRGRITPCSGKSRCGSASMPRTSRATWRPPRRVSREVERQALIADGIEPLEAKVRAVAQAAVEKAERGGA